MMPFVVDASMAIAWVVADEQNPSAEALLQRVKLDGGRVTDLFWHEIRNTLLKIEKRGRSPSGAAEAALTILRQLPLDTVADQDDASVLALARTCMLTPYDAAYLDVAVTSGHPMATLDRDLAAAARTCGVPLLGPYAPTAP